MRRNRLRSSGEEEAVGARRGLGLGTDIFGIEVLRAGIEAAQVALATIQRAGDDLCRAGAEAQRLHRAVRLDGMAKQIARTELRAEAALVAG
jgi:hypothetical protein